MQSKVKESRFPRIWKEEIEDYTIDLSKIQYKKKRKLTEDGSIVKLFVEQGKGTEAKFGSIVYFTIEARYKDGTLCNPRADRKGVNKINLKSEEDNKAFEIALANCKFGETFWCKFTGKLLLSLKFYKELPGENVPEGCDTKEIWCKFFILRIKHSPKKIFCDFPTFMNCLEESKLVAKEYIELAKQDEELYDFALELYKFWINVMKLNLPRQVKKDMTPDNHKEKDAMLVTLYLNTAFILLKREQYISAKEVAETVLEMDPNNIKGLFRLAQACIKNENLQEKAYNCLKICFEKEPSNPSFAEYKDWFLKYEQKKNHKKANQDQWKVYRKLLDEDELKKKEKRRKERVGEEDNEEDDKEADTEDVEQEFISLEEYEKIEGVSEDWADEIKEEMEKRENEKAKKVSKD